jgi:hypothetical protein
MKRSGGLVALTELAAALTRDGNLITQIHVAEGEPGEWLFAEGTKQHSSVIVPGATDEHVVVSTGERVYLDGRIVALGATQGVSHE